MNFLHAFGTQISDRDKAGVTSNHLIQLAKDPDPGPHQSVVGASGQIQLVDGKIPEPIPIGGSRGYREALQGFRDAALCGEIPQVDCLPGCFGRFRGLSTMQFKMRVSGLRDTWRLKM